MMLSVMIVGFVLVYVLMALEHHWSIKRRAELRRQAWKEAMGPPADWVPVLGEKLTRYRTNGSADRVAEILRATAHKYAEAAADHGLWVEIREFVIPPRSGLVEGRVTLEVVPFPTTS